jgi:valyl-tRNA synthetase
MLPLHDESIMISDYPKYKKEYVFSNETKVVDKVLEDIVNIRNLKATNSITKEAFVQINSVLNEDVLSIYKSQLKISDKQMVKDEVDGLNKVDYESNNINISYFFEGPKEDESKKQEEIKKLKDSIARREKLLANENYVNKAPKNIVDMDRQKLEEEKTKLELLLK